MRPFSMIVTGVTVLVAVTLPWVTSFNRNTLLTIDALILASAFYVVAVHEEIWDGWLDDILNGDLFGATRAEREARDAIIKNDKSV